MRSELLRFVVGGLAVLLLVLSSMAFSVREAHSAVVTRFGRMTAIETDPGLHWKLPWPIDRVAVLDGRRRVLESRQTEMLTRDKKNVILLSYSAWSIGDAETFFKAVGTIEEGERKLDGLVTNAKIGAMGRYDLSALVSTDPELLRTDELEAEILASVEQTAASKYGITVDQIGFKRVSFPEENTPAVLEGMRAERAKEAASYRARGEGDATRVRSETDRKVNEELADAREQKARIEGEADADAARIYAEAHALAPELFVLDRMLATLDVVLGENATLVMRTDKGLFSVLNGFGGIDPGVMNLTRIPADD